MLRGVGGCGNDRGRGAAAAGPITTPTAIAREEPAVAVLYLERAGKGIRSRGDTSPGQLMPPVRRPSLGRRARQAQSTDCGALRCAAVHRTQRLHAAVRTPRVASVRATPGEGATPRSARGPEVEAGAAHDAVSRRGAASTDQTISQCHGSDVHNSKILN
jgi:hypothetical protein